MSWTASYVVDKENLYDVEAPAQAEDDDNVLHQWGIAIDAAQGVIESGALGDPDTHKFNIYLTGHSNPDHEPVSGWANDHLSITLSQANK